MVRDSMDVESTHHIINAEGQAHAMQDEGYRFYCQSCERMDAVEDEQITLTVTSPPYYNSIDYDTHSRGAAGAWYRSREDMYGGYGGWLSLMERVFGEVFRVTRAGGFLAVIIGTVLDKGHHYPAPFDLVSRLCGLGWGFHQDIIWHKTTAGVRRAGVAIQKPYPGYFYPNIMTEYILVFKKPGAPIYKRANGQQEASRYAIDDLFKRDCANNIWHIAPVPPGFIDHPCPFPEEIPDRLIRYYSHRHDWVLDPFLGSGQTMKVARHLDRYCIGYEIEETYIALAKTRLHEPLHMRAEQLIAQFEKIPLTR